MKRKIKNTEVMGIRIKLKVYLHWHLFLAAGSSSPAELVLEFSA